ncbi:MAG: hypothetical protein HF978_11800 [Desulfobacteraceae bacterium]|nr:hypothetical protein [Desulfobacteraceae bacterium]MBC2756221.1 hypothetical protein [Desulfobacteraceae bacterium]
MNQKIEDKVTVIKESLHTAGLDISEQKNGIRLKLDSGYHIDIFTLTNSPGQIRARIKIEEPDPLRRQAYVESTQNSLSRALNGVASVEPFHMSREVGGEYFYNSVLELEDICSDNEPIEVSRDAVEVLDDSEPANDLVVDAAAEFEFDFDLKEDNQLKIVKTLAEEAIEKLETVDAKMLRRSLDMMSLKRSSAVRLAVTRIFRSAMEVEEIEQAIQNEAKKIVTPEDRMELQAVKALSTNGFLAPVVDLLWQEVFNDEY